MTARTPPWTGWGSRVINADAKEQARWGEMLQFERAMEAAGFARIAGVDEAGRGPLAGPVVAAAVVLAEPVAGLNDSKQLSEAQREGLFELLQAGAHAIGVAVVPADEIDRIGIQQANYAAMARAAQALSPAPDYLLIDGFKVPGLLFPQTRIIKGDARSLSIAAASIIAKVTRDRMMIDYDRAHPEYGFARHKGYGTREHLAALEKHGPCPIHRRSFAPLAPRHETGVLL